MIKEKGEGYIRGSSCGWKGGNGVYTGVKIFGKLVGVISYVSWGEVGRQCLCLASASVAKTETETENRPT